MALESFEYSKTWESSDDFPTIETDETQVRADIQCLYDEIAAGLNALITALNAGGIDTAQIADGAVTSDKLSLDVRAAIAEKELYWATYGSSNGLDIYSAVTANRLPVVKYSGRTYILSEQFVDIGSGYFNFVFTAPTDGGSLYYVVCTQTALLGLSWTNGSQVLGTYTKPDTGIPKEDLASSVQTSLEKADTALQSAHEVPAGGASGQVLAKNSNTDYDLKWVNQSGGGGTDDVFWATYGSTTKAELVSAYSAGKAIMCKYSGRIYYLAYSSDGGASSFRFIALNNDGNGYYLNCNNGTWGNGSFTPGVSLSDNTPQALGEASAGTASTAARSDHVHPLPDPDVFWATYNGSNQSAQIQAAIDAGKLVCCVYNGRTYVLSERQSNTYHYFVCASPHNDTLYTLKCSSNSWTASSIGLIPAPAQPSSNGTYVLACTVNNGNVSFSWEAQT